MRIAELASLHPRVKMNKMKLAIISLAVASYEVEGASLSPSLLHDVFFDSELDLDEDVNYQEDDEEEVIGRYMDLIKRELRYSWYHPSPGMFLQNFLRMMKEEDNSDLVHLASYYADLLTGFTGSLVGGEGGAGHLAPSLIARGSLEAARQTLEPRGGHKGHTGCLECLGQVSGHWSGVITHIQCLERPGGDSGQGPGAVPAQRGQGQHLPRGV